MTFITAAGGDTQRSCVCGLSYMEHKHVHDVGVGCRWCSVWDGSVRRSHAPPVTDTHARNYVYVLGRCRNMIVRFTNAAGSWTGDRRICWSQRPQSASKPIQNGGALRAPPFWIGLEPVWAVQNPNIGDIRSKFRPGLKTKQSHFQTHLTL